MLLKEYKTAEQYLQASKESLLKKELENNLILGICYQIPYPHEVTKNYQFLNVVDENELVASAISTPLKIILASIEIKEGVIKLLADHISEYWCKQQGIVGPAIGVELFVKFFHKNIHRQMGLSLYGLSKFKHISMVEGRFVQATAIYRKQLIDWSVKFYHEIESFPQKKEDAIQRLIDTLINTMSLFCWVKAERPVSMAAIIRRTDHIAIVGMVYTPQEERGNGYALHCVKKLSEYIFMQGYSRCGLFTDKDYPISNKIYQKIGYEPVCDFLDVEFS